MLNEKMIEIRNLEKSYDSTQALKGLSLSVKKGELFGLIGPDGAGKSTLMRILVTLLIPNGGEAFVANYNCHTDLKPIRELIGYMPGQFSLYPDLTVEENLQFFAAVFGTTIEANYSLIKDIYSQIEPFKKRQAGKLSGGMKQKLALSCALIHKPEVLILDEPTTGVDAVSRKEFWQMLRNLQKEGLTILVSTPYMDEAALCDRVALMQDGEILETAPPDQIPLRFDKPLFGVSGPEILPIMNALREWHDTETVYAFGQTLHVTMNSKSTEMEAIFSFLEEKGWENCQVTPISPTIEDTFIYLMRKRINR